MKKGFSVLSAILLLSSCINKTTTAPDTNGEPVNEITLSVPEDNNEEVTAERAAPLIIGGKQYYGYLGDRVDGIMLPGPPYWGFPEAPVYCTVEDIDRLLIVSLRVDPENPEYMSSLENLELLQNLKELIITGQNISKVDFSPIASLVNLEDLVIIATDLVSVDFTPLSSLFNLERLFIEGDISNMPDLTSLNKLKRITIKDSVLESLDGLGAPGLEVLDINMETFETLAPLSNLTQLNGLDIVTRKAGSSARMDLSNVPRLEFLTIQIDGQLDVTGIERLTGLAHVSFGTYTDLVNPQGISGLHNLVSLWMTFANQNPSIEYLRGLQNLERLYIEGDRFWRHRRVEPYQVLDVGPLANNNNLKLLRMRSLIIKNISALDNLKNLEYDGSDQIDLIGSRLFDETEKSVHGLVFQSHGH